MALADLIDVISERVSGAAIDNEQDWSKTAAAKDSLAA